MAEQRTKEIGIRKVLGASTTSIAALLSREFLFLISVANGLAWPTAYFIMRRMLNNYAYRTDITFWIFIVSGFISLIIATVTVSYQAVRAARSNPINSLRFE
jgi:putative ABC transport system permease protein